MSGPPGRHDHARMTRGPDHIPGGSHAVSPEVPALCSPAGQGPRVVIDAAGFDLRPDPLRADSPAALTAALRKFWIWSGRPSFRKLAQRAGGTPAASTICTMLGSSKLPTFDCMLAFLTACGATDEDCRKFATAWRHLSSSDGDGAGKQQIPAPRGPAEGLPDHQD